MGEIFKDVETCSYIFDEYCLNPLNHVKHYLKMTINGAIYTKDLLFTFSIDIYCVVLIVHVCSAYWLPLSWIIWA